MDQLSTKSEVANCLSAAKQAVDEVFTCSIVVAELLYGCIRSMRPAIHRAKVEALILPYDCLPFDEGAAEQFAKLRYNLELLGTPIGPYDLQIAAIALTRSCTLVTHNTSEFSRVSGLNLEDWELP